MEMKDLLGGKGANLAEMTSVLGLPVPPGFTISTDACRDYMRGGLARGPHRRGGPPHRPPREGDEAPARRPVRPAAGQRAVGGQVLDAGDDGHRPQPRAQRPQREGPGPGHRRRALRLRLVPPLHRHVRPHRARPRRRAVRRRARAGQEERQGHERRGPARRGAQGPLHDLQEAGEGAHRARPSRKTRSASSAGPSRRCSGRGTAPGPGPTATARRSRTTSAPR